jgi:hypothetical protein
MDREVIREMRGKGGLTNGWRLSGAWRMKKGGD